MNDSIQFQLQCSYCISQDEGLICKRLLIYESHVPTDSDLWFSCVHIYDWRSESKFQRWVIWVLSLLCFMCVFFCFLNLSSLHLRELENWKNTFFTCFSFLSKRELLVKGTHGDKEDNHSLTYRHNSCQLSQHVCFGQWEETRLPAEKNPTQLKQRREHVRKWKEP